MVLDNGITSSKSARRFNGINSNISFSSPVIPNGAKTIQFKFRRDGKPSIYEFLIDNSALMGGYIGTSVVLLTGGGIGFYALAGTSAFIYTISSENVCDGNWHDIKLSWDGTKNQDAVRLYVDDLSTPHKLGTSTTSITSYSLGTLSLFIGRCAHPNFDLRWAKFDLDNLKITDKEDGQGNVLLWLKNSGNNLINEGVGIYSIFQSNTEVIDGGGLSKYLIDDGGIIKTYQGGVWVVVSENPNTSETFKQHGMNDLKLITDDVIRQLNSSSPQLLVHTDNPTAKLKINYTPKPQMVVSKEDLDITLVEFVDSSIITLTKGANSIFNILASIDQGLSWKSFNSISAKWEEVNLSDIATKGMGSYTFNNITRDDWSKLITNEDTLRFAYYLEDYSETDTVVVDNHAIQLDMRGAWKSAVNGVDYEYDYPREDKLRVYLYKDGDYKINY